MSLDLALIVPARLASTRFPRKLLHEVDGKPLILWTAERLVNEVPGWPLFFAVAEEELAKVLRKAGFEAVLTDPNLPSGTDRVAAANREIGAARVINVQADEPLTRGKDLETLRDLLAADAPMATLAAPFPDEMDFRDPHKVKVVCGAPGQALYFSRAPIPFDRDNAGWGKFPAHWHLGLYGYQADFLEQFPQLPPGVLEQVEKLEQLRALEHGYTIAVGAAKGPTIGIDTPEDAAAFARAVTP